MQFPIQIRDLTFLFVLDTDGFTKLYPLYSSGIGRAELYKPAPSSPGFVGGGAGIAYPAGLRTRAAGYVFLQHSDATYSVFSIGPNNGNKYGPYAYLLSLLSVSLSLSLSPYLMFFILSMMCFDFYYISAAVWT